MKKYFVHMNINKSSNILEYAIWKNTGREFNLMTSSRVSEHETVEDAKKECLRLNNKQ